jgi:hypothetical protein
MKPEILRRLENTLLAHLRSQLRVLAKEDYWESDDYLLLAGILRVQLCDADWPVLIKYADYHCRNLFIYAPAGLPKGLERGLIFSPPLATCSRHWIPEFRRMTIDHFLDNPTGWSLVRDPKSEYPSDPVTPRRMIKWIVNKDGMAHFDPNPPRAYEETKNLGVSFRGRVDYLHLLKKHMAHLSEWSLFAASDLIAPIVKSENLDLDCRKLRAIY